MKEQSKMNNSYIDSRETAVQQLDGGSSAKHHRDPWEKGKFTLSAYLIAKNSFLTEHV